MTLIVKAGKLLRAASGALATACQCCIRYWCFTDSNDLCGNALYECREDASGEGAYSGPFSDCEDRCPEPPICLPSWCYLIDQDACGGLIYECMQDAAGEDAASGPFLEANCDGGCGEPAPCAAKYYCCYEECPPAYGEDEPATYCSPVPCPPGPEGCNLTKSGPHGTLKQCQENCQKYSCVPTCGGTECVPDPAGPYGSKSACEEACDTSGCLFAGDTILGSPSDTDESYFYSIDGRIRDVCISYVSKNSKPIRIQIWSPSVNSNCEQIASRVIRRDTHWRGVECCDCPDDRPTGDLEGGPSGHIRWQKGRGITSFEVRILNPCGAEYELRVECNKQCPDLDEPEPCPDENGFLAFDDSGRRFRRLGIYDLDCCYLQAGLPPTGGRPTPLFPPDDGYYILEKQGGACVVVESARWYAAYGWAVGDVVSCPSVGFSANPTWKSLGTNAGCCNADGSKIYAELTDELFPCDADNPLP